jgi:hypothetical protein
MQTDETVDISFQLKSADRPNQSVRRFPGTIDRVCQNVQELGAFSKRFFFADAVSE